MHPSKFFKEVYVKTGLDVVEIFDNDLKHELTELHPMNFIKTKITLPVYKVTVGYYTVNGNYNKSNKYMVMDNPIDDNECLDDVWADIYARDYADDHHLKNMQIIDITHICDAVLPIG